VVEGVEGVEGDWADHMASCYAHLRSALSIIDELSVHAGASPSDGYFYDQAVQCVWVALVALAGCEPGGV
jgi:hypothetical protein